MFSLAAPLDADEADDLHRAEQRRSKLERLSDLGMELAEEVVIRAKQVSESVESSPAFARAFASVSRAMRLTLTLEARFDTAAIAIRNRFAVVAPENAAIPASATAAVTPQVLPPPICPRRVRVRAAVWEAVNQEMRSLREATEVLDCLHENLIERDDYEALLDRPWREVVETICSDLGLHPDWSRWSDELGFVRESADSGYFWQRFWRYSPERAEERRRRGETRPPPMAKDGLDPVSGARQPAADG